MVARGGRQVVLEMVESGEDAPVVSQRDLRVCVYTTLTGRYEKLNEQPVAEQSSLPFLCLTDDAELKSACWETRVVPPMFGMDPVRSQRDIKLRPHLYLPEFDASVYVDNSVVLREPPERLFDIFDLASGFCLPEHSFRETVMDEFLEVARRGLDDQTRIFEQLNHYLIDCPDVLQEKPFWSGILVRDHRNAQVRSVLEAWAAHVHRYSRRDQLSLNLALRRAGLAPQVLPIDNHSSRFHSWPNVSFRDRGGNRQAAVSLAPPAFRLRALEQELAQKNMQIHELEQALSNRDRAPAAPPPAKRPEPVVTGVRTSAGVWVHVDPRDQRGRRLVAQKGDLNPKTLAIWHHLLAEGAWTHILDVGANYGEMLANGGLPEGARIIAIEPNPVVRRYLTRTLTEAGIAAKVRGIALSDTAGQADLLVDKAWSGKTRLADLRGEPIRDSLTRTVRTSTLAALLRREGKPAQVRALVKIDVEGNEVAVLRGALKILDDLGAFVALVEILHLGPADRDWLVRRFDVEVYDPGADRFEAVVPASGERLAAMLSTGQFYPQDVILRRKRKSPRPRWRHIWARLGSKALG